MKLLQEVPKAMAGSVGPYASLGMLTEPVKVNGEGAISDFDRAQCDKGLSG